MCVCVCGTKTVLVSYQALIFGLGCRSIVGASGYLAPFTQIFCLDWFLLWASERLICQMHKALHICPASPTHKVNASLFISHFAFSFSLSLSFFCFFSHCFLLFPSFYFFRFVRPLWIPLSFFLFPRTLSFICYNCMELSPRFLSPFVFIITQRALLARHQGCHQLLLFHFLPVFLLFFVFPFY